MKKKYIKTAFFAACAVLMFTVFFASYILNMKSDISGSLLRLHIVADSDSERDQALKLLVRDRILADFSDIFADCRSRSDAEKAAKEHISEIEASAKDELLKNGADDAVTAAVESCPFPTKSYGNVKLPRGQYTALNIKIGSAAGHNWWCVMYPPLCITDKNAVLSEESKDKLKKSLTAEEYRLITEGETADVKIKFRIAEILGKYFK